MNSLTNRRISVTDHDFISNWNVINGGFPQDFVLAPILLLLYIMDLLFLHFHISSQLYFRRHTAVRQEVGAAQIVCVPMAHRPSQKNMTRRGARELSVTTKDRGRWIGEE